MAFKGGNFDSSHPGKAEVAARIAAAIKQAQKPAGLVVPPSTINDSMYGATGEWHVLGGPELVRLPPFKFSLSREGGGTPTIRVTVKDVDIPVYSTAGSLHRFASSYRSDVYTQPAQEALGGWDMWQRLERLGGSFTPEWKKLKADITTIIGSFNYDKSDMQSDYFDTGFYHDVRPHPAIQAKSYATCEKILDALEVAFPERWPGLVVRAAEEEADAAAHPDDPAWRSTKARTELARDIHRALDAVRTGSLAVPFNPKRRGWSQHYAYKGKPGYLIQQKKLKTGLLVGYVGEAGKWLTEGASAHAGRSIGSSEHEWAVMKKTGGRGGTYRETTRIGQGLAPSLEDAIRAAEAAMGIEEKPLEELRP